MKLYISVRYHDILNNIALQAAEVKVTVTINRKILVIVLLTTYLTNSMQGYSYRLRCLVLYISKTKTCLEDNTIQNCFLLV